MMLSPGRRPLLSGHRRHARRNNKGLGNLPPRLLGFLGLCFALSMVLILVLMRRPGDDYQRRAKAHQDIWEGPEGQRLLHEAPSRAFCDRESTPHVCAHGGDPQEAPPNTLRAFKAATDAGYECIEVDVVLSADGVPVVLHVRELQMLQSYAGIDRRDLQVGDLTIQELESLQWPSGDRVETAHSVIRAVWPYVETVILDVKTYNDPLGNALDGEQVSVAVADLVQQTGCRNCLIWAKWDSVVERVKQLLPDHRSGYVVMNETAAARAEGMHNHLRLDSAEVVAVHHAMVEPGLLQQLHSAGKQGYGWTADQPHMMRRLLDVGVDAIVTSHPQRLSKAIQNRRKGCLEIEHEM